LKDQGSYIQENKTINTGWLTLWSTRNMKTANASRENGFESVPAQKKKEWDEDTKMKISEVLHYQEAMYEIMNLKISQVLYYLETMYENIKLKISQVLYYQETNDTAITYCNEARPLPF